jgi:hypothetical protein
MKTLFASAFLAVAVSAVTALTAVTGCSSDNSSTLVTDASGSVGDGQPCGSTADCETNLTCAYPVLDAGKSCPTQGVCIALGPFTAETVCPCGGTVYETAWVTPTYTTVPLGGSNCTTGPVTDGGGTTPPVDSGSTVVTKDAGSSGTDAASGGSKTGG